MCSGPPCPGFCDAKCCSDFLGCPNFVDLSLVRAMSKAQIPRLLFKLTLSRSDQKPNKTQYVSICKASRCCCSSCAEAMFLAVTRFDAETCDFHTQANEWRSGAFNGILRYKKCFPCCSARVNRASEPCNCAYNLDLYIVMTQLRHL